MIVPPVAVVCVKRAFQPAEIATAYVGDGFERADIASCAGRAASGDQFRPTEGIGVELLAFPETMLVW